MLGIIELHPFFSSSVEVKVGGCESFSRVGLSSLSFAFVPTSHSFPSLIHFWKTNENEQSHGRKFFLKG